MAGFIEVSTHVIATALSLRKGWASPETGASSSAGIVIGTAKLDAVGKLVLISTAAEHFFNFSLSVNTKKAMKVKASHAKINQFIPPLIWSDNNWEAPPKYVTVNRCRRKLSILKQSPLQNVKTAEKPAESRFHFRQPTYTNLAIKN